MCFENLTLEQNFIANERAKATLAECISSGRLPHALLIEGAAGTGKKTFAKYAAALFLNDAYIPGTEQKIMEGIHPDVAFITSEGKARSFHVDTIRQIKADAYIVPNQSDRRIFILADCETMSASAANALLKVLEEPPPHCMFILTADSTKSLLETVVSRSMVMTLYPPTVPQCAQYLREKNIGDADAKYVAKLYEGNIGNALSFLQDDHKRKAAELAFDLLEAICTKRESKVLFALGAFEKDRQGLALCLQELVILVGFCMHERYLQGGEKDPRCAPFIRALTPKEMIAVVQASEYCLSALQKNANQTLAMTQYCVRLASCFNPQ